MGVTIHSKNYSIDLGYSGFNRLRTKIAELTNDEIFEHYKKMDKGVFLIGESRKIFFEEYNEKISKLEEDLKIPHGILDFLYASDCNGKLPFTKCKQILRVIENYDDDIAYGYLGRRDCAMFKDFKKIIQDCVENKCKMEWY